MRKLLFLLTILSLIFVEVKTLSSLEEDYRKITPRCPRRNEEFSFYGSACPDTCDNYGKPRPCLLIWVQGCFCKPNYVRDRYGNCVRPYKCRRCRDPNAVIANCPNACPWGTCDVPDRPPGVTCVKPPGCRLLWGCQCKVGYVNEVDGGRCIPRSECTTKKNCLSLGGECVVREDCGRAIIIPEPTECSAKYVCCVYL